MAQVDYRYAGADFALALHMAEPGLHRYDRHSHDEYSIIVVTTGAKILRVGPQVLSVRPGQIVVVPPGASHDCEPDDGTAWSHRCLYVSPELMACATGDRRYASAPPRLSHVVDAPRLAAAIVRWHEHRFADAGTGLDEEGAALVARLMEAALLDEPAPSAAMASLRPASRRIPDYLRLLQRNLASPLDLDRLAERAGVSKFQVIRDVRATMHTTPGRLLRDLRLREAKRLIRGRVPVAHVPTLTGFSDQSHLIRAFKSAYAITPGVYQRAGATVPSFDPLD